MNTFRNLFTGPALSNCGTKLNHPVILVEPQNRIFFSKPLGVQIQNKFSIKSIPFLPTDTVVHLEPSLYIFSSIIEIFRIFPHIKTNKHKCVQKVAKMIILLISFAA